MNKKQGIIDYSEPEINNAHELLAPVKTNDGTLVYTSEVEESIDRSILGIDDFTISYHGLARAINLKSMSFEPRKLAHLAVVTEELSYEHSAQILSGGYLSNRTVADSLSAVVGAKDEYSLGYANMTSYSRRSGGEGVKSVQEKLSLKVARGIGDLAVRALLIEYIETEISREEGQFLMEGSLSSEDIDSIISNPDFSTAYALGDDGIQSVVILADTPGILPWFNEERIQEVAEKMGQSYENVKLAFLALTSPGLRQQRLAPVLFDLAFSQLEGVLEEFVLCTECSPRSISYTPHLMARHLRSSWDRRETLTERTKIVVYPKTKL